MSSRQSRQKIASQQDSPTKATENSSTAPTQHCSTANCSKREERRPTPPSSASPPKKIPATQLKQVTTTTTTTVQRQRQRKPVPLSTAEVRRRQRLRLLQLARRGASVAAALLLSNFSSLRVESSAEVKEAAETQRMGTRPQKRSQLGLPVGADASEGDRANQTATTTATTDETPSAAARTNRLSARAATAAQPHSITLNAHTASQVVDANGTAGCGDQSGGLTLTAPIFTAAPCSYAQLWRGLLQLQFSETQDGEARENVTATSVLAASSKNNSAQRRRASLTIDTQANANKTKRKEEEERKMWRCPVSSLSHLADELRALDGEWRALFIGDGNPARRISTTSPALPPPLPCVDDAVRESPRGSTSGDCSAGGAYAHTLTEGECYTLRRYTAPASRGLTMALKQTAPCSDETVPAFGEPGSVASYTEEAEARFFMDYI